MAGENLDIPPRWPSDEFARTIETGSDRDVFQLLGLAPIEPDTITADEQPTNPSLRVTTTRRLQNFFLNMIDTIGKYAINSHHIRRPGA